MIVNNRFLVRIVAEGEGYGVGDKIIHDRRDPLIEFYDTKFADSGDKFGPRGQFVSRYYAGTIAGHSLTHGLNLHGGVDDWQVPARDLRPVVELARKITIESCDECGAPGDIFARPEVHETSCSLHPANTVEV